MNADDKESLIRKIHEALGGDGWAYSNWGHAELRSHRQELEAVADLFATATERATKAEQELATCRVALEKTRVEADRAIDEAALSRAVVEAVRHLQAEIPHIQGNDEDSRQRRWDWQEKRNALMSMPLPPEEKTT